MRKKWLLSLGCMLTFFLVACNGEDGEVTADQENTPPAPGGGDDTAFETDPDALTIATVNNPDMQIMQDMAPEFEEEFGIDVEFIVLPENELRRTVTEDVALGSGQFDIVTIGTYDAPIWAENEWVVSLEDHFAGMSAEEADTYDRDDIFDSLKDALSYEGELYALPFYGESSILYYNKEMVENAGVEVPLNPTWEEVRDIAAAIQEANDVPGIILRGLPGWGEMFAPLNTIVNAFGGKWYDTDWNAQLTNDEFVDAIEFYVDLVNDYGQSGATSTGFTEALTLMSTERAGMWYDATVAAGFLNNPDDSDVVDKIGYAFAPSQAKEDNGWLWAWSLAIGSASENKDDAFKFITWATSREYVEKVGEEKGWVVAPPGTRQSTYENPEYQEVAPFAEIVLESMERTDFRNPTVDPVPYYGIQYVAIPEFQQLGTEVSQEIASALAGQQSVQEALETGQAIAERVAEEGGYKN